MKHNAPGLTLEAFIAAKPIELRLGQWFVNCYVKRSNAWSQEVYQLDGDKAKYAIQEIMACYHWDTLPEYKT